MKLSEVEKENDSAFLDTFQSTDEYDMSKEDVVIKWVLEHFYVFRGPGNGEIRSYSELKEKLKGLVK